jgi:hypothetical protein
MTLMGFLLAVMALVVGVLLGRWTIQRGLQTTPDDTAVNDAPSKSVQFVEAEALRSDVQRLQAELAAARREAAVEVQDLRSSAEAQLHQMRKLQSEVKGQVVQSSEQLAGQIAQLTSVVRTFERWDAQMHNLLAHNREMHARSEEFATIVPALRPPELVNTGAALAWWPVKFAASRRGLKSCPRSTAPTCSRTT